MLDTRSLKGVLTVFIAGFLGTLVFHQMMLGLLHLLGVTAGTPWVVAPTMPLGVPVVVSASFWGGLWAIVMLLLLPWLAEGTPRAYLVAFVFGAVALTLVAWFVVAPLKGAPVGFGFHGSGLVVGPLVNGAWGVGTVFFLGLLARLSRTGVAVR